MKKPIVAFIVAASENDVIGRNGDLPWRLKSELRMFRRLTLGKPVIMGRKTFASLGRPLDGRDNIVISRSGFTAGGVISAASVDEAIRISMERAAATGLAEVFIIGGADIFEAAMAHARRIYFTLVHATIDGDVFFARPSASEWRETRSEAHPRREGDDYDYTAKVFERIE